MKSFIFICQPTSTNDVIESLNKSKEMEKKPKIINTDTFSKITDIGMKELFMCLINNNTLFDNLLKNNVKIYTSLEYSTIESGLSLLHKYNGTKIYPLPFMYNNININLKKDFFDFKSKFGTSKTNNNTDSSLYWKEKKIGSNFRSLKDIVTNPSIKWEFINKAILQGINTATSFNFLKFKTLLLGLLKKNESSIESSKIIIIGNSEVLINLLSLCNKNKLFNKNRDYIETTSIWEFLFDVKNDTIEYQIFKKIYPLEFNHGSLLEYVNPNIFIYKYKNYKYNLFNTIKPSIPFSYIKTLDFNRFDGATQKALKVLFGINNVKENVVNNIKEYVTKTDFIFNNSRKMINELRRLE